MPDKPRFDDVQTAMQAPPPRYQPVALRRKLSVRWTDGAGEHAVTIDGRAVLGSAPGGDLVIADRAVSRIHAEVEVREDGAWLRDLGSRNGTFVEGVQVKEARIPDGGQLRVGSTVVFTHRDDKPSPVDLWPNDRFGPLLGKSLPMRELFARLARVSPTESTVLIQGETGTGKELVARAIHDASPRATQPFVIVDCAALVESVLEAELFGHAKGAFTGAVAARTGAIEAADKGTVFLDEIGELPLSLQPKLLRVLESRTVRPVGETAHRKVDVRFLSVTHRDLRTMVNTGAFREDLYFRLSVLPVTVPPLRDRPEDIPLLMEHFAPGSTAAIGPELLAEIQRRPWLGNVRELRNFVERVHALGPHEALALTAARGAAAAPPPQGSDPWSALEATLGRPLREAREAWMDTLERAYVQRLLERHARNVSAAAQEAGVDRTYIYRLIRKHEL